MLEPGYDVITVEHEAPDGCHCLGKDAHVIATAERDIHATTPTCVCGPASKCVEPYDGRVYTHRSLIV